MQHQVSGLELAKMQDNYSQRELDMKFQQVETKIDDSHSETLDKLGESNRRNHDKQVEILNFLTEIKNQTQKTNGRVNKLEGRVVGIIMCCSLIIIVVLPLLGIIYQNVIGRLDMHAQEINQLQSK